MRKTTDVTITSEGRDKGKLFRITEMDAEAAEDWAFRVLNGMVMAGTQVPDDIAKTGMFGLVAMGFRSILTIPTDIARPLLKQMIDCVMVIPDPRRPEVVRALVQSDIEEVATRLQLRSDVFELHAGFSIAGSVSQLMKTLLAKSTEASSLNTQMSQDSLDTL